jgi:ADP-ribosylglycohydrolase
LARQLLLAVAAGDSAGIPSEFVAQSSIPALYQKLNSTGWPFSAPGGGPFGYPPNCGSDDTEMATRLVRAFEVGGRFKADLAAEEFARWLAGGPRDVGGTIRSVVGQYSRVRWFDASLAAYRANPKNAANGGLMRNGVMAAMAKRKDMDDLLRISLLQTALTHFSPLCVLCSAVHSWLIRKLLDGYNPMEDPNWQANFWMAWDEFLAATMDGVVNRWHDRVGDAAIAEARAKLQAALSVEDFNPFVVDFQGQSGYVLLTLEIALWALKWSYRDDPFPVPAGWPPDVFERRGGDVVGWIPLLGNDCDSYGACAGPMIWAAHKQLPESLTAGLTLPL